MASRSASRTGVLVKLVPAGICGSDTGCDVGFAACGAGAETGSAAGAATAGSAFDTAAVDRSEEHTSELQSLMRISYAVFCLKKKKTKQKDRTKNARKETAQT